MTIKTHKRAKQTRNRGRGMGTCGSGARKNKRKSGNKGGVGMSGTGKRADHKKTLITKLYGHSYFGKQGVTSRGTKRDIRKRINLSEVEQNIPTYVKKGIAKKTAKGYEINLKNYKILGNGEVTEKLFIRALEASSSAIEKIKKAGGDITVQEIKLMKTPLVTYNRKDEKKGKKVKSEVVKKDAQ